MSGKPVVQRLRVSSRFACSRCGGREAYCCQGQSAFQRYVLNMVMVRTVRCCDCDGLCYAFPVRVEGHIRNGNERTALVARAA
jgi:hypothetical protein